jgi:hypothetical protein
LIFRLWADQSVTESLAHLAAGPRHRLFPDADLTNVNAG